MEVQVVLVAMGPIIIVINQLTAALIITTATPSSPLTNLITLLAKLMKAKIQEERIDVTHLANVRVKDHAPELAGAQVLAAAEDCLLQTLRFQKTIKHQLWTN